MPPLSPPSALSSVHYSNAGHDFHVLWATRRIIELLNPVSTLRAVKMEGVAVEDTVNLPAGEERFLAADLTEYYGGEHFATADRTIIAQLKYSTQHPDVAWTAARLRESKGKNNSVFERLLAAYQDLLEAGNPRADVQQKAMIRLISNQPLHANLLSLWRAIQTALEEVGSSPVTYSKLLKQLPIEHHVELNKIYDLLGGVSKQGAKSKEFTDFWRILDLSGCGTEDRMGQQLALMQELAPSVPHGGRDVAPYLTDLVRRHALPPDKANASPLLLTRASVLAALGVVDEGELFPEPSEVTFPAQPIPTAEAAKLAQALLTTDQRFLAHGEAGVGKTTTVQQLRAHLPTGSVVLIYDCYGGGKASQSSGRHTLRRAFWQMSNELALATGLPFLVVSPTDKYTLRDHFQRRLTAAAKVVEAAGGLLVLVADAADNSAFKASKELVSDCFIPFLWELKLPANCRLLMTARTHRRASLQAPSATQEIGLTGFDLVASTLHLRQVFPAADEAQAATFYQRTGGNPRVQNYCLDPGSYVSGSEVALVHTLTRPATSAARIIEDILNAALIEVAEPERAKDQLATLAALNTPIPLDIFAAVCRISSAQATTFCQSLTPGLLLQNGFISFQDEDFENQLRERSKADGPLLATYQRLGNYFRPLATTNAYAAQAVAEQFTAAERRAELIELALESPPLTFITDSAERVRIERKRLELALQAAAELGADLAGAKLLVLAAERLQANHALKALVTADIALAAHFGNVGTVTDYFRDGIDDAWLGTVHYQLAAYYATDPGQRARAKHHLVSAHSWVDRYFSVSDYERHNWNIEASDIASEAEAYYWLHGPEAACQMLQSWSANEFSAEALYLLLQHLVKRVSGLTLEKQLCSLRLPLMAQVLAQAALWETGYVVSQTWSSTVAARLLPLLQKQQIKSALTYWSTGWEASGWLLWPLHLAELFVRQQVAKETTLLLLGLLPTFSFRDAFKDSGYEELVAPIRIACLQAYLRAQPLTGLDLLPPLKKGDYQYKSYSSHEDDFYRRDLDHFIALYAHWAQWLSEAVVPDTAQQLIRTRLLDLRAPRKTSNAGFRGRQAQWLRSAISLLVRISGSEVFLTELLDQAQRLTSRALARGLWRHTAREVFRFWPAPGLAFRCLERVVSDARADELAVHTRWSILLTCAAISFPYDEEFSRGLYTDAINAAYQGVGDDVAHRLAVGAQAASQLGHILPPTEGHAVATQLAGLVEAYRPYLSEDDAQLPTHAVLAATATLSPAAGVALCLRWDTLDIVRLPEGIGPVVKAATGSHCWQPAQALWLLKLRGEFLDISHDALEVLAKLPYANAAQRQQLVRPLSAVATWVARDTPLSRRPAALQRVAAWANDRQLSHLPAIRAIQQTLDFANTPAPAKGSTTDEEPSYYEIERQQRQQQWTTAAQQGNITAFAEWLTTINSSQEALVPALLQLGYAVLPARRVEVLDLLLRVRSHWESQGYSVLNALTELLSVWHTYGPVREWAVQGLPDFYGANLARLAGDSGQPAHLEQFCQLPLVNQSRATMLLPDVARQLDSLSSDALCQVATALLKNSSATEVLPFVHWLLERMQAQLQAEEKTLPFGKLLAQPETIVSPPALFAQLIWAVSGDPDKRVRWQSVHAARQLMSVSENDDFSQKFLFELLKLTRTTTSWLPTTEEFYWQGARVWVLTLVDRLADEQPTVLAPHLAILMQHLFDAQFPHAQIRELARRILLKVHAHAPMALLPADLARVQTDNRPASSLLKRGSYVQAPEVFPEVKRSNQFKFNELDTVDHWFESLAETFGQTRGRITALVEHWMLEKWHRTAAECEADRLQDQDRYQSGLLSHYKIDDTTVDSLEMHLTHHALMCVAGSLVDKYPIRMDNYSEQTSTWEEWLARYLPHSGSPGWLSDWRGPTPLRPECWGVLPLPWRRKPLQHYREALGFGEPNRMGWMVLHGRHSFKEDEHAGGVSVSSVPVATEAAKSLLWALQTAWQYDYVFPTFGLSDREPEMLDGIPALFTLIPLLTEEAGGDERGLERHDMAARNTRASYPALSTHFIDHCILTADKDGQHYFDSDGRPAVEYDVWDDNPQGERGTHSDEAHSAGHCIWVREDLLLSYLASTGQVLLVHATLARNVSPRKYSQKQRIDDIGTRRLALLYSNGSFETVAGPCTPQQANNSGAG
jgi:hypothetical protein